MDAWVPPPDFYFRDYDKSKDACFFVEYDNGIRTNALKVLYNSCNSPLPVIDSRREKRPGRPGDAWAPSLGFHFRDHEEAKNACVFF